MSESRLGMLPFPVLLATRTAQDFKPWRLGDEHMGPSGLCRAGVEFSWGSSARGLSGLCRARAATCGVGHACSWHLILHDKLQATQSYLGLVMRLRYECVGPSGLGELEQQQCCNIAGEWSPPGYLLPEAIDFTPALYAS